MAKHQHEGSYLWFTSLSPKSDHTMCSRETRDGQSSLLHILISVALGYYMSKRLRLKCSSSCGRNSAFSSCLPESSWNDLPGITQKFWQSCGKNSGGFFFNAWWITYSEVSGLIIGFPYLQTSRVMCIFFYLHFYIWSNKRVQSCYILILSKESWNITAWFLVAFS